MACRPQPSYAPTVTTFADLCKRLRHTPVLETHVPWRVVTSSYRGFLRARSRCGGIPRTVNGCELRLRYPFGALVSSDYEPDVFAAFDEQIEPGMTVFDVGASYGLYTLLAAARVGGAGRVRAFEPSASSVEALRAHIAMNHFDDRCDVVAAAVDERPGTIDFHEPKADWLRGTNMMASLSQAWVEARASFTDTEVETSRCRATTIDEYCADSSLSADLIKIDVEGAEGKVLRGAQAFLARRQGRILLEVHPFALESLGESVPSVLAQLDVAGWTYRELDGSSGPNELLRTTHFLCRPA